MQPSYRKSPQSIWILLYISVKYFIMGNFCFWFTLSVYTRNTISNKSLLFILINLYFIGGWIKLHTYFCLWVCFIPLIHSISIKSKSMKCTTVQQTEVDTSHGMNLTLFCETSLIWIFSIHWNIVLTFLWFQFQKCQVGYFHEVMQSDVQTQCMCFMIGSPVNTFSWAVQGLEATLKISLL